MKERNYAEEYARRVARGVQRGLSKSQSRGHARPGEAPISAKAKATGYDRQLEAAVKQVRRGKPLSKASASVGVSAERLRSHIHDQGIGKKTGGRWQIEDTRTRELPLFTDGETRLVTVSFENSQLIGEYAQAVKQFLETNDPSFLEPFVGKSVTSTDGRKHTFETDPNELYRLALGSGDDFSRYYRIPG